MTENSQFEVLVMVVLLKFQLSDKIINYAALAGGQHNCVECHTSFSSRWTNATIAELTTLGKRKLRSNSELCGTCRRKAIRLQEVRCPDSFLSARIFCIHLYVLHMFILHCTVCPLRALRAPCITADGSLSWSQLRYLFDPGQQTAFESLAVALLGYS